MTLQDKLIRLNFLSNSHTHLKEMELSQIESFVNLKVSHLFLRIPASIIQEAVTNDTFPQIVNYLTHIIEVGCIKSVAYNHQGTKPRRELATYLHIMVWAYNITLAMALKQHGMENIPALENGLIDIYYNDNALLMIVDRIEQHISMGNSAGTGLLNAFADGMIREHLVL